MSRKETFKVKKKMERKQFHSDNCDECERRKSLEEEFIRKLCYQFDFSIGSTPIANNLMNCRCLSIDVNIGCCNLILKELNKRF